MWKWYKKNSVQAPGRGELSRAASAG